MRLLVVEDETDLALALSRGLRREGYAVDLAERGAEAEEKLAVNEYDLVCLDWNLPDGSGLGLCHRLVSGRLPLMAKERPPVLMITAHDTVADRVEGLDAGADDYLIKPFAFPELAARVRALLRRRQSVSPILKVAGMTLDPTRFEASRDGRSLELSPKEFALLRYFMSQPGVVFSQESLLEHVWDEMADPFTNTVRMTISNLRKKLGEPPNIETIAGVGYVLREDQL